MTRIYANRNTHSDFVKNAITKFTEEKSNVYIAVAFFTESSVVEEMARKGCRVRLVIRLGFPTSPSAIKRIMGISNVEIRYFTDHSFHPKLYIFGDKAALVGSANLTTAAILTNQEVVTSIEGDDPRFSELSSLFQDYWVQAKVMTDSALSDYEKIYKQHADISSKIDALDDEVIKRIGRVVVNNITRDEQKESDENIFIEDFRKSYQECVSAFNVIRDVYEKRGYRKAPESLIPLRLEIDSFISFIKDCHARGELWESAPSRSGDAQKAYIDSFIDEWSDTYWEHFEQTIVKVNYPKITKVFYSADAIIASSDDELLDAISVLHSFHDRLRFFDGGLPTLKNVFLKENDRERVRRSLSYLVFGKGDIAVRMANLIYNSEYKLNQFGRANVQELIGWINNQELPVINGRTTKVLRFFGFDVQSL